MSSDQPVAQPAGLSASELESNAEQLDIVRRTSIRSTQTDQSDDSSQPGSVAAGDTKPSRRHSAQTGFLREPLSGGSRSRPPGGARRRTKKAAHPTVPIDDLQSVLSDARRFAQENYECSFCSTEEPTFQKMLHHISIAHPWYDLSIHRNIR